MRLWALSQPLPVLPVPSSAPSPPPSSPPHNFGVPPSIRGGGHEQLSFQRFYSSPPQIKIWGPPPHLGAPQVPPFRAFFWGGTPFLLLSGPFWGGSIWGGGIHSLLGPPPPLRFFLGAESWFWGDSCLFWGVPVLGSLHFRAPLFWGSSL